MILKQPQESKNYFVNLLNLLIQSRKKFLKLSELQVFYFPHLFLFFFLFTLVASILMNFSSAGLDCLSSLMATIGSSTADSLLSHNPLLPEQVFLSSLLSPSLQT